MKPTAASMPVADARRPTRWPAAARAARIIHPFPTLLNVAATAGLAFVAAAGSPDVSTLVRMMIVMFCAQSAIGITNDLFDRDLDARAKPWKPLVSGLLSPSTAMLLDAALIAVTMIIAATLGVASFALAMLGLACGLAYDAWFKRSPLSALPFMVAIPTLPLWVWATLDEWHGVLWWVIPLGALVGLSLHLANTLPDIDDDAAYGVRGLAHRLGARGSAAIGWSSFAAALLLSLLLAFVLDYDLRVYAPAAIAGAALLVGSIIFYAARRDAFALQSGFGAIGIASAIVAVGWLAAVT